MMKPLNHACFEVAMADLLGRAYEAFPAPLSVHFEEVFEEAMQDGKMPEHCPTRFVPRHSLYGSTLDFLIHEGLLRVSAADHFGADGLVLTSKGFLILNKPLEKITVGPQPTIGQQLVKGAKRVGSESLSKLIAHTIDLVIKSL